MTIIYSVLGIFLSISGMMLVARKWNISSRSNLVNAAAISMVVALPFLWIYPLHSSDWLRLACSMLQSALSIGAAFTILFIRFWRDPDRSPVEREGVIVSPADGHVIYVKEIPHQAVPVATKDGKDYLLQELTGMNQDDNKNGVIIIGIEMSIMNVHVNRCPIEGYVQAVKHIPGYFYSLRRVEAPFLNTRCTTVISNESIRVATVQIASRLVRKIDRYLTEGQCVALGERLGMIRFGSQVDTIIPNTEQLSVCVSVGQSTQAGVTILARYKDQSTRK